MIMRHLREDESQKEMYGIYIPIVIKDATTILKPLNAAQIRTGKYFTVIIVNEFNDVLRTLMFCHDKKLVTLNSDDETNSVIKITKIKKNMINDSLMESARYQRYLRRKNR